MSEKITVELDSSSIRNAIAAVREYQQALPKKAEWLRQSVGNVIVCEAAAGFNSAIVDDTLSVPPEQASVQVTSHDSGDSTFVVAVGEDAVWVEFGAGVYHNGALGSSPNPLGAELGFVIGSHGVRGRQNKWVYARDGSKVWTHGTPAKMPMYKAFQEARNQLVLIAMEVFES